MNSTPEPDPASSESAGYTDGELRAARMANAMEDLGRAFVAFRREWNQTIREEWKARADERLVWEARIRSARAFLRRQEHGRP